MRGVVRSKRVNWIEGIHYRKYKERDSEGMLYEMVCDMAHRGHHGKTKTIRAGTKSDGATCALDLCPEAFFVHDEFCRWPFWDDGTPVTNWEASREYRKILIRNGHGKARSWVRHYATFLFGGGRVKKLNGWI